MLCRTAYLNANAVKPLRLFVGRPGPFARVRAIHRPAGVGVKYNHICERSNSCRAEVEERIYGGIGAKAAICMS